MRAILTCLRGNHNPLSFLPYSLVTAAILTHPMPFSSTDFRDCGMPDSPDIKPPPPSMGPSLMSPKAPHLPGVMPPGGRPLSSNSNISGMNGSHSPLSTINGRTPSPPSLGSLMNSSSGQQLPPACGARQLSKLKRFLTTLQQFGSDISPEIGERVRSLVLALVVSLREAVRMLWW